VLVLKVANVERVADEVKTALKPFFLRGEVDKEEYKDIMRRAVPKVTCCTFSSACSLLQFSSVEIKTFCHCENGY